MYISCVYGLTDIWMFYMHFLSSLPSINRVLCQKKSPAEQSHDPIEVNRIAKQCEDMSRLVDLYNQVGDMRRFTRGLKTLSPT